MVKLHVCIKQQGSDHEGMVLGRAAAGHAGCGVVYPLVAVMEVQAGVRPVYMVEDTDGLIRETFAKFSDARAWYDQHLFDNGKGGCSFTKCNLGHHTIVRDGLKVVGRILTIEVRQSAFASSDGW